MQGRSALTIRFVRPDGLSADAVVVVGQAILLGRDASCDVRLDGRKVSRRHVRIEFRTGGSVILTDQESHNGTYVNGARVVEVALNDGDIVQAGEWEGRVELAGAPRPTTLAVPGMMPALRFAAETSASSSVTVTGARMTPSQMPRAKLGPRETPVGEWNWEDTSPPADALREARVEDNPIVRRFAESQVDLDLRGLSELSQLSQGLVETPGLRPAAPQAIDGIALRLVFQVTAALANAESMDAFLDEMCGHLQQAARAKAVIVLLPDDSGFLSPRVVRLRRQEEKVQLSRTVIEHATRNKSALTTEDARADERFARGESVLRFDLKAVLCVPLMKGADVVGALYLTRDLPFSNTERDLVAALGQLIAMGLERSRLREEYAHADRTRRSLERFHAPDVVRRLMMESSAPMSARGDGLFLEPLRATVLFCDLTGFTKWCETHDAEQVGRVLNLYLEAMTDTAFAHGGTVDKFIGDAIMCIFGAPFMSPDDPLRAVACAVEMRRAFRRILASGVAEEARGLDVHIGVNTGPVVAGTVGSPKRMEYTALGDTVNVAARLEGVAKAGQIVLGPTTASLVCDQVAVRALGPIVLKGRSEPLEVYEVPDDLVGDDTSARVVGVDASERPPPTSSVGSQ